MTPGFQLIAEKIFERIDPKTLANCRCVSKTWRYFVDYNRVLIVLQNCQLLTKTISRYKTQEESVQLSKEFCQLVLSRFKLNDFQSLLAFTRKTWSRAWFFIMECDIKSNLIQFACIRNHEDIVRLFLDNDIDIDVIDAHGSSPLHPACYYGSIETVHILLPRFSHSLDNSNRTAMHIACRNGHLNIVQTILDYAKRTGKNVGVNDKDIFGCTPFHESCFFGKCDVVSYLLNQNVITDMNSQNLKGRTPFFLACQEGHVSVVRSILDFCLFQDKYLEINSFDIRGRSIGHAACKNGHSDILQCLLNHEKSKNTFDVTLPDLQSFTTPLHYACANGNVKTLEVILEIHPEMDLNVIDGSLNTPLHLACKNGNVEILIFLLNLSLIQGSIKVNEQNNIGETPLHRACIFGHEKIVQVLLDYSINHGYCININAQNHFGWTPLHSACFKGRTEVIELLLNTKNIQLLISENNGETPFFMAVDEGYYKIAMRFVQSMIKQKIISGYWTLKEILSSGFEFS